MGCTKEMMMQEFPPKSPSRIKMPVQSSWEQCEFKCMSGDPQCGCWNEYLMAEHYNQEKYQDHKEGNFPPIHATI